MRKIRIAIVGVGNCASSLIQGINFYRSSGGRGNGVGLMHRQIGPYRPDDIEVVAAFDIDRRKVGTDVGRAVFAPPNCTKVFCEKIALTGAIVKMGVVLDSYAERIFRMFERLHTRKEYQGSGIGLAICRSIAEHHGGTITATSTPGRGSTFTVVLPSTQMTRVGM